MTRMKRCYTLAAAMVVVASSGLAAQNVGGGVSVWLPEALYLAGDGSVGVETAAGSSVGMGDLLSVPFGVVFNQVYGLMPEMAGTVGESPWFYTDAVTAYLMAKVRLPAGPIYVDAFGGFAGYWAATLRPLVKNIESDIAPADHVYTFESAPTLSDGRFGWGWQAGGGIGVRIDRISVDINITYRLMRADATLSGTYSDVVPGSASVTPGETYEQALKIRLAGFSIGIDASYEM